MRVPRTLPLAAPLVAALLGCARAGGARGDGAPDGHASPRVAALARAAAAGDTAAGPRFWRDLAGRAPLVEPLPGVADTVLVTYAWRGDSATARVALSGGMPDGCGEKPLRRVPGTDAWVRSERTPAAARWSYRFRVNAPEGLPASYAEVAQREQRFPTHPDPLNANAHPLDGSMARLASAPPLPAASDRPLRGRLRDSTVESAALGGTRPVWIYTPPGFDGGDATYPLLVVLDGRIGTNGLRIPALLEALAERGAIAPTVAVFVGNPDPMTRARDYMGSAAFTRFLADELVPAIGARYRIAPGAARRAIAGVSLGGLAALAAGVARPERFGGVISLSGAHWYRPDWQTAPLPLRDAEGAVTRRVAEGGAPAGALRVFVAAGAMESACPYPYLAASRRLAEALRVRDHRVRWVEYAGGHDVENWQLVMPAALEHVLGGAGSGR